MMKISAVSSAKEQYASCPPAHGRERRVFAIILIDKDGFIRQWGPKAEALLGFPSQDTVGKHYNELFSFQTMPDVSTLIDSNILESGVEHSTQVVSFHRDGHPLLLDGVLSVLSDLDGQPTGVVLVLQNIEQAAPMAPEPKPMSTSASKEAAAEALSAKSIDLLGLTFEQAAVGLVIVDMANCRFLRANSKICSMLGYTPAEFCQKDITEVTHPDDVQIDLDNTRRMVMGEIEKFTIEKRLLHKDGRAIWTQLRPASIARDENGIALYGMAVIEDISDVKKTEEALRESENRFQALADSAPVMIFVSDTEPKNVYVNKVWLDFTGVDHAVALSPEWHQVIHPDDRELYLQTVYEAFQNQQAFQHEVRVQKVDGQYKWLLITAVPRFTPNGLFLGFIGSGIDISKLKNTEEALLKYQRKLEQSNRDLQHFAYIASHDLQAPLRKINIFSEYLAELEADKLTDEGKDYLGRIQKSTQKMQALVSDLLELSRVSSKLPNFKPISLQQVIENVVSEMSISLQKANGTVQFDALPLIEGDPQQLEQLFVNLLDNAIKFRKPDVAPVVQIAVSPSAEAWNIEFKDNGLGFPQDKAEHIFGIFERLHPSQQYEGTGIGLSIVKRIVERHSGRIVVASEPGQGATFNIHLPMKQITSH